MIGSAIFFVLGTVLVSRVPVLLPLVPCAILLPLLLYGLGTRLAWGCAFLLGCLWCHAALVIENSRRIPPMIERQELLLTGEVTGLPRVSATYTRFMFRVSEGPFAASRFRLYWHNTEVAIEPGQVWTLNVRLQPPTGSVNFKTFDYEGWLFVRRIHGLGYVSAHPDNRLQSTNWSIDRARNAIRLKLMDGLPKTNLPTFLALSLGDTSQLTPENWKLLNGTGTTHLLIVSGLHVGLIATLVFAGLRLIGVPRSLTTIFTLSLTAGYALLAGWGLPVQRALVMVVVYLGCLTLARNISLLSRLVLAACFVTALDPLASLANGFWLSFGVVAALVVCLSGHVQADGLQRRVRALFGSQWVACISLLPILAVTSQLLPLGSFLVNLLAIPVTGFVLVPLVLFSLLLLFVSQQIAMPVLQLAGFVADLLWQFLAAAAQMNWQIDVAPPGFGVVLLALAGAAILLAPRGLVPRWSGLALLLMLLVKPPAPATKSLRLTFLDVGQGLSVLLETTSGVTLYDTGPSYEGSFSAASQIAMPVIRGKGWSRLDELVISHTDNDHAGGKDELLSHLGAGRVIEQGNCDAAWERDGVSFLVFAVEEVSTVNNASCLLLMVVGKWRGLLTGDLEAEGEYQLLQGFKGLVDFISVPHHGSDSSSTPALLNQLLPKVAVVSAGYQSRFGHPVPDIRSRYLNRSIAFMNTAESGAIQLDIQPSGVIIREARNEPSGIWRRR